MGRDLRVPRRLSGLRDSELVLEVLDQKNVGKDDELGSASIELLLNDKKDGVLAGARVLKGGGSFSTEGGTVTIERVGQRYLRRSQKANLRRLRSLRSILQHGVYAGKYLTPVPVSRLLRAAPAPILPLTFSPTRTQIASFEEIDLGWGTVCTTSCIEYDWKQFWSKKENRGLNSRSSR